MANYNYYEILELSIDPPEIDAKAIEARINEKNLEWSKKARSGGGDSIIFSGYLGALTDIKKIMLNDAHTAERERHSQEALKKQTEKAKQFIKNGRKASTEGAAKFAIGTAVIAAIEKGTRLRGDTIEQIARELNTTVVNGGAKTGPATAGDDPPLFVKPSIADKMTIPENQIKIVGKKDLYDFLSTVGNSDMTALSCADLIDTANKKKNEFTKHDDVSSAGQKLCSLCLDIFKTAHSKAEYEQYLVWKAGQAVCAEIDENARTIGIEFTEEAVESFINRFVAITKKRPEAEAAFYYHCKKKKYRPSYPDNPVPKFYCPHCGSAIPDKSEICPGCGKHIYKTCPKCGEQSLAKDKFCVKCSFNFADIDRAEALCEQAEGWINRLQFQTAAYLLDEVEKLNSQCAGLPGARGRMHSMQGSIGKDVDRLKEQVKEARFYAAGKTLEQIKTRYPSFSVDELSERIDMALREAQACLDTAKRETAENRIIEACVRAYALCRDHPDIGLYAGKYAPKPVTGVTATCDGNTRCNSINWHSCDAVSAGVSYCVVRKKGGRPQNRSDGEVLGEVTMLYFADTGMEPGVEYYYGIIASRLGVDSAVTAAPTACVNLFELQGLSVTPGDGCVQVSYESPAPGASVKAWRQAGGPPVPGGGQPVANVTHSGFTDSGLTNDTAYGYRLCVEYGTGDKRVCSAGVTASAMPMRPPKAVENLSVTYIDALDYRAEWDTSIAEEVRLYCGTAPLQYQPNVMMSLDQLDTGMTRLHFSKQTEHGAVFSLPDERLYYIVPAVVKKSTAVLGAYACARRLVSASIQKIEKTSTNVRILINPIQDAHGYLVLYANTGFARDPGDRGALGRKNTPAATYAREGAIFLEGLAGDAYYFSLFTSYRINEEIVYSSASQLRWSDIPKCDLEYAVAARRAMGGKTQITVTVKSSVQQGRLPQIRVVASQDSAPLYKDKGVLLGTIPPQLYMRGVVTCTIPSANSVRNMFAKLFFEDDECYKTMTLKAAPGSSPKIS